MKSRSSTNSRKHENLTLRRSYAKDNPLDEIQKQLGLVIGGARGILKAQENHHILGSLFGNRRQDVVANFIRLHSRTHRWVTKYREDGIVLCCLAKLRKGEFDPVKLSEVYTFDFVGWFSTIELKLQFPIGEQAWREVTAFLETIQTKESENENMD
jgi:hypothetical protein